MALQKVQKDASDFLIDPNSFLELSEGKIVPSPYEVSPNILLGNGNINAIRRRSDGKFRLIFQSHLNWLYKIPADMSGFSYVTLSDGDLNWKFGMCIDDENYVYVTTNTNPGYVKKYADDGTLQWTYSGVGSTPAKLTYPKGIDFYDNRIFIADANGNYIHIINKSGVFVDDINVSGAGKQIPVSIWVDDTGIYSLGRDGWVGKWNVNDYSFVETNQLSYGDAITEMGSIRRLQNGNFIFNIGYRIEYLIIPYLLVDTNCKSLDEIGFTSRDVSDLAKGGMIMIPYTHCPTVVDESGQWLYMMSRLRVAPFGYNFVKATMKSASERIATYQHDFGSEVTLKKVVPLAQYDNRKTVKQLQVRLQYDGGGYNLIDLADLSDLDQNVTILDIELDLTDWRFINRERPWVKAVNIYYEDGKKDIGERTFEALEIIKETEIIDISNELEVLEL